MDVDGAMGIHLPQDIIMEIFSRLPVRSLFRFKCLSKFWMTFISEPYFVMKHFNHARRNQNSQKIRLVNQNLSFQYCSSLTSYLSSVQLVDDVQQELDWPSSDKPRSCKIYCCYNGLALLGINEYKYLGDIKLLLWNPSTRESIILPQTGFSVALDFTCGLGYDSTSDDYKILKVGHQSCSELLSLKSGSWRKIGKHPSGIYPVRSSTMDSLAFLHGAFHWLGLSLEYVVSLDISKEVYTEIPLPDGMFMVSDVGHIQHGVSVLGGMLCVHSTQSHPWNYNFKFWVLKDYGVKEPWNQLFNIRSTYLYAIIPEYMFSDGEVLLRCRHLGRGCVFQTSKELSGLWLRSAPEDMDDGFVYTESLISPKLLA
ncbi:F-box/kelch-repeat protein At3g06240-like [Solanum verrucosum]|uniref:F-box/kelch-repeat protein At3g06240-like n=1 Tax=Solanum verrucosum TaxID=315347 RepID=UPI0020D01D02|nr:F-box/kelch-repeat protein At3g06240-like [Solanum verrucosum]